MYKESKSSLRNDKLFQRELRALIAGEIFAVPIPQQPSFTYQTIMPWYNSMRKFFFFIQRVNVTNNDHDGNINRTMNRYEEAVFWPDNHFSSNTMRTLSSGAFVWMRHGSDDFVRESHGCNVHFVVLFVCLLLCSYFFSRGRSTRAWRAGRLYSFASRFLIVDEGKNDAVR